MRFEDIDKPLTEGELQKYGEPLTLDKLCEMEGKPVFINSTPPRSWFGWVVFTSHDEHSFKSKAGLTFPISEYGKSWAVYRSEKGSAYWWMPNRG